MPKPTEVAGINARSQLREAAPKILLARLSDVRRYEPTGQKGLDDPDAVHDMRVATRRLRATLSLLGDKKLHRLDGKIKALQDRLGEKRQLQLDIAWLERDSAQRDVDGLRLLLSREYKDLRKANEKLDKAIQRWREETAPRITKRIAKLDARGRLGGQRMRRKIRKQLDKVTEALRHARPPLRPEVAHQLRIRAKKLRYQLEIVAPAFGGLEETIEKTLPDLQTELGDLHDSDSRVDLLRVFADDSKVPVQGELKRLIDHQQQERLERARKLLIEIRKLDLKKTVGKLVAPNTLNGARPHGQQSAAPA